MEHHDKYPPEECPCCGANWENILDSREYDTKTIYIHNECLACGLVWTEVYHFAYWEERED